MKLRNIFLAACIVIHPSMALADSLTFSPIGASAFNYKIDPKRTEKMTNNIGDSGHFVYRPQADVLYDHDGWLFGGSVYNDEYGYAAYSLKVGCEWPIFDEPTHTTLGAVALATMSKHISGIENVGLARIWDTPDFDYGVVWMLRYSHDFMLTEKSSINLAVESAGYLTNVSLGFRREF